VERVIAAIVVALFWLLETTAAEAAQIDAIRAELATLTAPARAEPGHSRVESRAFFTPAMGAEMHYFVYLPPDYDYEPEARYPVSYMLHGIGGSNTEWSGYGLFGAADELIKAGAIRPLLIVLPLGDQGYWFDHADGKQYGTYVARDLVREIDGRYRTQPIREARAVGGLSMGAIGALQLGINYPGVFGVVGAHGPPLRDYAEMVEYVGPELAERWLRNDERYWAAYDPVQLYPARAEVARRLKIGLDVGADDPVWRPAGEAFHRRLDDVGVPHEFRVYPGDHNGDRYWRPHAQRFLRFYDEAFG
jgi:enterochelin esterase-like enzyme